jgi:uncharacterized coiled-coil protein SlyX
MSSVADIAKVIQMLADVVKHTREIVEAVNDGRKFLASRYPEAQQDFSDLLGQMQRTIEGLAEVTKVISGFRFVCGAGTVDRETADRELARFNDYVVEQKEDVAKLKNRIRDLRADCEKVRALRDKLDARTDTRSWGSLFGLFGVKAHQRALELHGTLSNFYADDQRMVDLFRQTLELAEGGIKEVENALGPPGIANPYNVPAAAAILGTYAMLFDKPQSELHRLADVISEARTALRP